MSERVPPAARVTAARLRSMKSRGEKIACLTAYDATFARILGDAGIDVILVGDSLGMVVQGHDTTVPVHMDDMIYHCRSVARARAPALLMADLPFMELHHGGGGSAEQRPPHAGRSGGVHQAGR